MMFMMLLMILMILMMVMMFMSDNVVDDNDVCDDDGR